MKIGINTLFYIPGEVGGSETYLLEILREWKRQHIPHEVILFTNLENHQKLEGEFSGETWSCVLCPFKASRRVTRILREQIELPLKVKKMGIEVLWSPGYTAPFVSTCPQVVSILDMQYKRFPRDLSFVGRWTTEVLVQMVAVRAKRILTISEFSKNEILEYTRAQAEKVFVTPLAADSAFSEKVGGDPVMKGAYILCVANTYPHKNVDQLVRAFVRLEEKIPHQLVLVGRPRLGESSVQKALQGLQDKKRFCRLSGLSRAELVGLYQQADLFVFPSLYEGFGLPVLEAMQAGVPVLTTRCGSIPEVGGAFVAYVEGEDDAAWEGSLLRAVNQPESLTKSEQDACEEWLGSFSWQRASEKTLASFVEVSAC